MTWTRVQADAQTVILEADLDEAAALTALRDEPEAADALSEAIRATGFEGLFWECRRLTGAARPFQCAIVASPRVAGLRTNWRPFTEALRGAPPGGAAAFDNLGGRSRLVSPTPSADLDGTHLAAFLRSASVEQQRAVWRVVADEAMRWMATRPLWLSTSGLGVSWLHVRLDPRPKYYTHAPYRRGA